MLRENGGTCETLMDRVRKEISEKKGASASVQHAKKTGMKCEKVRCFICGGEVLVTRLCF